MLPQRRQTQDGHRQVPRDVNRKWASTACRDTIRVRDLKLNVSVQEQGEGVPSPVLVTLAIAHDTRSTAAADNLSSTINYASVAKTVTNAFSKSSTTSSLNGVAGMLASLCLGRHPETQELSVRTRTTLPSGAIAGVEVTASRRHLQPTVQLSSLDGLQCRAIIGVNPEERTTLQPVVLDVAMEHSPRAEKRVCLRELEDVIVKVRC